MTAKGALGVYLGAHRPAQRCRASNRRSSDVLANDAMVTACEWGGLLAGLASEELDEPYAIPEGFARGPYLLVSIRSTVRPTRRQVRVAPSSRCWTNRRAESNTSR